MYTPPTTVHRGSSSSINFYCFAFNDCLFQFFRQSCRISLLELFWTETRNKRWYSLFSIHIFLFQWFLHTTYLYLYIASQFRIQIFHSFYLCALDLHIFWLWLWLCQKKTHRRNSRIVSTVVGISPHIFVIIDLVPINNRPIHTFRRSNHLPRD